MSSRFFEKYVSENTSFAIDWAVALSDANDGSADTIATSVWQEQSGITVVTSSNTATMAKVRISGGVGGVTYKLENKITLTTSGYTRMDYIMIKVNYDPVNP